MEILTSIEHKLELLKIAEAKSHSINDLIENYKKLVRLIECTDVSKKTLIKQ